MKIIENIRTAKNLVREFGLTDATFCLLSKSYSLIFKKKVFQVKFKKFHHHLHIRTNDSDWDVFKKVFLQKEYREPSAAHADQLKRLYNSYIEKGVTPLIIDCGANIGMASIWYARIFPKSTVIAIEPESCNFDLLRSNVSKYNNIIPINAGISCSLGRVNLSNVDEKSWSFQTIEDPAGPIELTTIDKIKESVINSSILVVKIDIEGFEAQLFSSNTEWLAFAPLIVAEFHDWLFPWKGTSYAMYSKLCGYGAHDHLQNGENNFYYSHSILNN